VRKGLLLVGLVLLLAVPLMLMLRGVARGVIVVPFLYFLWVADLFFKSVPQPLFWALFLGFALLIAARSLFTGKLPKRQKREAAWYDKGQLHVLARWVHLAARGGYFKWRLAQHLRELTVEVLAYREGTTPEKIKRQVRRGRLDAPAEIEAFLQAGLKPLFSRPAFLFSKLLDRFRSRSKPSLVDLGPESVVQFLEDHLEIEHDHRNR
jgi:hypothetical protein